MFYNTKDTQPRKGRGKNKQARIRPIIRRIVMVSTVLTVFLCVIYGIFYTGSTGKKAKPLTLTGEPEFTVNLLTPNPYSRPQMALEKVKGIVVHYTANPGSSAEQNRDYFEGLKDSHLTKASSHFIIGIDGEIIQCIPSTEMSYASNDRNVDTISIECCHPDADGKFTDATYASLVKLTTWLCGKFELTENDVIRHYDVTGKKCPLYFVEHEDAWEQFRNDVAGR
ncbi:hypothetical protein FACS1894111_04790 [Clostridia bacterium]|nr:hypothetical protein FACS1894111_04790 [Clostridia bacterium]